MVASGAGLGGAAEIRGGGQHRSSQATIETSHAAHDAGWSRCIGVRWRR